MMPVHLRDSAIPKHEQLRTILLRKCTQELQPGDLMTSERNPDAGLRRQSDHRSRGHRTIGQ